MTRTSKKQVSVWIEADTLEQVEAILQNPLTKRTRRGAMVTLIESLLMQWLAQQKMKGHTSE